MKHKHSKHAGGTVLILLNWPLKNMQKLIKLFQEHGRWQDELAEL